MSAVDDLLRRVPPPPARRAEHHYGRVRRFKRRKDRRVFLLLDQGVETDTATIATRSGAGRRTIDQRQLLAEYDELVHCACGRHHPKSGFLGCPRRVS